MIVSVKERGGSFRDLRERHLPLFDDSVRRHDRGWPHEEVGKAEPQESTKNWRTAGIFHFRHGEEEAG